MDVLSFAEPASGTWPLLRDASVNGNTLTITYDQPLDENSVPPGSAFGVNVFGRQEDADERGSCTVPGVAVSGDTVTLTLVRPISCGDTVRARFGYTPPASNPVQNPAGHDAPAIIGPSKVTHLEVRILTP